MITSVANANVRLLRGLAERRGRLRAGLFLVEGVRLAEEAIDAGIRPDLTLYDESSVLSSPRGQGLIEELRASSRWLESAAPHVIASISEVQHNQGLVMAVPLVDRRQPRRRRRPGSLYDLTLVLDGVADPGNTGTIFRAARAAGVDHVLVSERSADPYAPKVVRAAAGAHFWLHLEGGFSWAKAQDVLPVAAPVILAEADRGEPVWSVDWSRPAALVVASEAHGPSQAARRAATARVRIPMPGGGESLNVAMATSILLFEAVRQRASKERPT